MGSDNILVSLTREEMLLLAHSLATRFSEISDHEEYHIYFKDKVDPALSALRKIESALMTHLEANAGAEVRICGQDVSLVQDIFENPNYGDFNDDD